MDNWPKALLFRVFRAADRCNIFLRALHYRRINAILQGIQVFHLFVAEIFLEHVSGAFAVLFGFILCQALLLRLRYAGRLVVAGQFASMGSQRQQQGRGSRQGQKRLKSHNQTLLGVESHKSRTLHKL
ncbi:hypothetical protein UB48_04960 [Pseudomonas sp. 2(2015)]|nr:hypothetical protein UB48_04960 [Pseudomonas sp. 2(2015)]